MYRQLRAAVAAAAVVVTALVPSMALAQTAATGNIEGTVVDSTGGVLPGVTVVVKNVDTNETRELVSDEGGRYRATALQPGNYEVKATLAGFQDARSPTSASRSARRIRVDVAHARRGRHRDGHRHRRVADSSTRARTDVSNVVGETAISNLPINGRRWENFVLLGPASPTTATSASSAIAASPASTTTTRSTAPTTTRRSSPRRAAARARSYSISQAAIKEFQVGISNFSAEFGRAAGGTVNAVTKSGTNAFARRGVLLPARRQVHGRGSVLPGGVDRPDERRQQFGVSPGRPDQPEQGVLLRELRPAAARLPVLRAPEPADVLRPARARRRVPVDALRFYDGAERLHSRAKATTRSCSARSTTP